MCQKCDESDQSLFMREVALVVRPNAKEDLLAAAQALDESPTWCDAGSFFVASSFVMLTHSLMAAKTMAALFEARTFEIARIPVPDRTPPTFSELTQTFLQELELHGETNAVQLARSYNHFVLEVRNRAASVLLESAASENDYQRGMLDFQRNFTWEATKITTQERIGIEARAEALDQTPVDISGWDNQVELPA